MNPTPIPGARRARFRLASLLGAATMLAAPLGAQGTLSGLGFGYPVGGSSTRSSATGGAFAEFDAVSPRNPASVAGMPRTLIAAQTEPEFRTLQSGSVKERTTAQRVPLLLVAFPAPRGVGVALSASTFLDRSFTTLTRGSVLVGDSSYATDERRDVRGSIGDLRGAIGWRPNARIAIGVAGHLFTGDNLVATLREFVDTTAFGDVLDSARVTYFGTGVSIGADVQVVKGLAVAASYRSGGRFESRVNDTVRTRANIPNRLGASVRYDGIPGAIFAAGVEQQDWSRMGSLGSALVETRDATNFHAGAEVSGPRLMGSVLQLRAGYARNALPFGVSGRTVSETRLTTGFGLPFARESASFDFSLQRANRVLTGGGVKESAWLVGVGIQLRP